MMTIFKHPGFTLVELLIALTILGEIATFTIPKVLTSQQNGTYKASAKEAIATLSAAYQQLQLRNGVSTNTLTGEFTPYLNYVGVVTDGTPMDLPYGAGTFTCTAATPCYRLHGGGALLIYNDNQICSTNNQNYFFFLFDPDGKASSSPVGPGTGLGINVYYNGRVNTGPDRLPGDQTCFGGSPTNWGPDAQNDWFSW